jgi:hypothetical protein
MTTKEDGLELDIKAMLPRITEQVAAELRTKAVERFQWQVSSAVEEQVKLYITERIVPEVQKELAAHESEMRAAMVAAVRGACVALTEHVTEAAIKKMASYDGDKAIREIMTSLFGRGY